MCIRWKSSAHGNLLVVYNSLHSPTACTHTYVCTYMPILDLQNVVSMRHMHRNYILLCVALQRATYVCAVC